MSVLTADRAAVAEAEPQWEVPTLSDAMADPSGLPLERVEAELCTLAGQIAAATCRFLRLLAAFDAREGWAGSHVRSCAQWLSWRCGMDLRTAREHVRVARSLSDLPDLTAAFAAGRLSYSKVRAVTRVATAETEADLVEAALSAPASQLERLVRGLQTASEADGPLPRRRQGVQWRWDDDGSLVVWGRLAPDEGARLLAGLTRLEHQRIATDDCGPAESDLDTDGSAEPNLGADDSVEPGTTGISAPGSAEPGTTDTAADRPVAPSTPRVEGGVPSDLGPALVAAAELACTQSEAPTHAPGAEVVVHVDVDTFSESARRAQQVDDASGPTTTTTEATPAGRLEDGPALTAATVHRLACDGRIQLSVDGPDGRTLDLGRRRRRPTDRQLTALWRRDHGCTVPGCGRTRYLHSHHVMPWALGGATSLDNLILLCGEHHRLLHDGRFAIVACGEQRFRHYAPDGRPLAETPDLTGEPGALAAAYADITPDTIEPDWDGADLRLHDAVATYLAGWAMPTPARPTTG